MGAGGDGLTCRAELYEETVRYYETGQADGEVAEVSGGKRPGHSLRCIGHYLGKYSGSSSKKISHKAHCKMYICSD